MNGSVLLLGGGRGLGRSLSRSFLKFGVPLFWVTRSRKSLSGFAGEVQEIPGSLFFPEAFDICDRKHALSFLDRILSRSFSDHPPVLAIHNAGYLSGRLDLSLELQEEVDREIDVNFLAPLFWSRRLSKFFAARGEGGHIFLSSGVARTPRPSWGAYGIAKGATEVLSRQLAVELPPPLYSLTFNPGGMATDMRKLAYPEEDPVTLPDPEAIGEKLALFCLRLMDGEGRKFNGSTLVMEDL